MADLKDLADMREWTNTSGERKYRREYVQSSREIYKYQR